MSKEINNLNQSLEDRLDLDKKQDKTDENLLTESKDLVGAINELFQSANNGKRLIANAIGNPLITANSTFSAMSESIIELKKESGKETDARELLYDMMIKDGHDGANNEMTIDELIDLLGRSDIDIGGVKQVACGNNHTFILKRKSKIKVLVLRR